MTGEPSRRVPPSLRRHLPILTWLPAYDRRLLRRDVLAGTVVAALAVPQSLGYASIAGVPVQVGLYAVPVALLAYAVFGSSPQLVVGPVSTVSVLSASLVAGLGPSSPAEAMTYTSAIALAAGALLVLAGVLRVGWVAEFLSKPIVTGFVLGLTLLVILGELPNLLGIRVPMADVVTRVSLVAEALSGADLTTVGVGAASLVLLFLGPLLLSRVPWALVVLTGGLIASRALDLPGQGVVVVGAVPGGLPLPSLPLVPVQHLVDVLLAGGALAFIGLAEGLSAGRLFAARRGYRLDTDQELLAAGAANAAAGLSGGLGVAGSLSKTAALDRAGGRSQVAGLVTAGLTVLTIVLVAPALSALPKAVLSAIVVHAVWGLMDVPSVVRYWRIRRNDGIAALVAALGVLLAGPLLGLLLAVGQSLLGLVYRSSQVDVEVLGKIPGEKAAWGGLRRHPERRPVPGIVVLRVDVPLFWVNAAEVQQAVLAAVDAVPGTRALLLDLESTDQLETTSADVLAAVHAQLAERGVDLYLVRVRWPVRTVLARTGLRERLGEDHVWHSISQGVRAARQQHGIDKHSGRTTVVDAALDDAAAAAEELVVRPTLVQEPRDERLGP